jgi:hypothetical protein
MAAARPYAVDVVTPALRIGSYRVERLLGVGSFATVWLGHDPSLDARVAIKVLAENWSHDLRVRERFLDEARLLWRLDSDRVVRVHALGELDDGRPYLVMAWAGGGSLRDRLAQAPVSVERGRWLLREICAGVAVLHDHGIVHRDLTPGNVLLTADPERVVIADLGLAKALAVASGLTARAGTPGYMAPEQDDPLSAVDRRADVYGLGRLGMTLLGVPPVRPGEIPRLRDGVPRGIADVLRRATARRPEDRYRDAAAFGAALDRAIRRPGRAGPLVRTALAAAAVVLLGAAVSDSVTGRFVERPGTAVDASGRMAVALPAGWRSRSGPWDPSTARGHGGSAMILSPDPARWTDPSVRGAFVGLTRTPGTPAAFLAHRRHPGCTAEPVRAARLAGVDWLIAGFRDCPDGRSLIVEAAGTRPGAPGLAYVELVPGPDGAPAVDTLLAGVRLR